MRGWAIGINWTHVALWRRWLLAWFGLVGFALVAGAHLGPRPDEILFAVTLPLLVIVPYAAGCLVLALLRLLLKHWHDWCRMPTLSVHRRFVRRKNSCTHAQ